MTQAPELKPCPFCGCKDVAYEICSEGGDDSALCLGCGATAVVEAWNTRADLSPAVKPLDYVKAQGETIEKMRANLVGADEGKRLTNNGDVMLVWVNQADLHAMDFEALATRPTVAEAAKVLLKDSETIGRLAMAGSASGTWGIQEVLRALAGEQDQ